MKTYNKFKSLLEMAATAEEITGIRNAVEEVLTTFVMRQRGVKNISRVDYDKSFNISTESAGGKYIVYDLLDGEGNGARIPGGGEICFVNVCQRISYFFREFSFNPYIKENFIIRAKNSIRQGKIITPENIFSDDSYIHYLVTKKERSIRSEGGAERRKAGSIKLNNVSGKAKVILDFKNISEFEIIKRSDIGQ